MMINTNRNNSKKIKMKKYIIFDLDGTLISSQNQIDIIIYDYIINNFWKEKAKEDKLFWLNNQWSTMFYRFLNLWLDEKESRKRAKEVLNILNKQVNEVEFMDWTIEKIKQLSKDYKLFLSTWSSTAFAEKFLKKWWVDIYFEKIMWSDKIPKSNEHIEIFKEISTDENFCKLAISVWDWQKEEQIAYENDITFIHIWDEYKTISDISFDKY